MSAPFEDFSKQTPQELVDRQTGTRGFLDISEVPFWGEAPESWDTVVIAGIPLPGICAVEGEVERRHDRKRTPGVNGASVTYMGDDQAKFQVTVRLWTPEHLKAYADLINFLRDVSPTSEQVGKTGGADRIVLARQNSQRGYSKFPLFPLDIVHPTLSLHKIKSAHVLKYGFPKPDGEASKGIYLAVIHFIEYVPGAKGAVTTAKQSVDTSITSRGPGAIGRKALKPSQMNGKVVSLPTDNASFAP